MNKIYAGIGARKTPQDILKSIVKIGEFLAKKDFILRSGGANGADSSFEEGCDLANGKKEIYLPWLGFNDNQSRLTWNQDNYNIAKKYHPYWAGLGHSARRMMARNTAQILGQDCKTPVDFVVCWTEGGKMIGGTSQALRIALDNNIKIFNLAKDLEEFREYCKQIK